MSKKNKNRKVKRPKVRAKCGSQANPYRGDSEFQIQVENAYFDQLM